MRSHYDSIYLSPHLDDAVLSCGGQIYQQTEIGRKVLIVSIMAGDMPNAPLSDFAQSLHERWQLTAGTVAARRAEDAKACALLSADYIHWDVPDCIYRYNPADGAALYASEEALFGPVNHSETDLIFSLAKRLDGLPLHDRIFVPLTAGNHVDHQLTRLAAEQWLGPAGLIYYEDYPYSREQGALATVLLPKNSWQPEIITLTNSALQAKIRAAGCYRSQISTFFDSMEDLAGEIAAYSQQVGGERLWRTSPFV